MVIWGGDDVLIGPGADVDKSKAEAIRKATLRQLGIAPLSPYESSMMDDPPLRDVCLPRAKSKVVGRGAGNWRDTPRQRARRQGLKMYHSDRLCPRQHQSLRYVSTSQCVVCVTACVRGYRAANPERAREVQRAWRAAHPEKSREYVRNRRERRKAKTTAV